MEQLFEEPILTTSKPEAVRYLEDAIARGEHWYLAVLEAISLWTEAQEVHNGRHYRYLIAGEAFNWLLLIERLCDSVYGLIPENEKMGLLFHGQPPIDVSREQFQELIGSAKYHTYLNYVYGVTVEEALILAVHEEVRKERYAAGYARERDITSDVYRRIYGKTQTELLRTFRDEQGFPQANNISLTEMDEFTYWLFKYRFENCDKSKVASDTKKGIERLRQLKSARGVI